MDARCRILFSILALIVAGASSLSLTGAQEATPDAEADRFPLQADPALCTGEPRPTEELLNLWFPPEATPTDAAAMAEETPDEVTIPLGSPADAATTESLITAVHEIFSCFAAGDYARALAFFTDEMVALSNPGEGLTREEIEAFLENPPPAATGGTRSFIVAITDVMHLDDGRVGAFVVESVPEGTFTIHAIFEQQEDGRWLADEFLEFSALVGDEE